MTLKVQRLVREPAASPWPKRLLLLLGVAVGGALLGQMGSALLSRMLAGGGNGNGPPSVVTRAASLAERQSEIDALLLSHDSGGALLLIDDALAHFPNEPQLGALRRRTDDELKNRFRYQAFEQLVAKRNYIGALAVLDEISADSPYRHRAGQELPVLRLRLIAEQIEAGQAAAKLGQCAEARQIAARVQALEPNHAGARGILDSCASDAAAARRP